uniref:F-box domain-containing protein n=1 Tax=Chenopodium quinoa TaxID=63459 RepID=A0A803NDV6_CHEQI
MENKHGKRRRRFKRVHLPLEMWLEILSRLPIKPLAMCTVVCKKWRYIVYNFRKKFKVPNCGLFLRLATNTQDLVGYFCFKTKKFINIPKSCAIDGYVDAINSGYDKGLLTNLSFDLGPLYKINPLNPNRQGSFFTFYLGLLLLGLYDGTYEFTPPFSNGILSNHHHPFPEPPHSQQPHHHILSPPPQTQTHPTTPLRSPTPPLHHHRHRLQPNNTRRNRWRITRRINRSTSSIALANRPREAASAAGRGRWRSDKEVVREYFNGTGFQRWKKIYGETDDVNKVQLDIRIGHAKTVESVVMMLKEDGSLSGVSVCDAGCGTGSLSIPLAKEGALVCASDISAAMVQEARLRYYSSYRVIAKEELQITDTSPSSNIVMPKIRGEGFGELGWERIGELFPGPSKATRAYLHAEADVERALQKAGWKIRKRGLTTTQFYFAKIVEAVPA